MTNPNITSLIEEFRKQRRIARWLNQEEIKEICDWLEGNLETIDREAEARGRNEAVDYIMNSGLFDDEQGKIKEDWVECLFENARTLTNKE